MSEFDQPKTINGKRLVGILAIGSVLFTVVMGVGTYGFAKLLTPFLQDNSPYSAAHKENAAKP